MGLLSDIKGILDKLGTPKTKLAESTQALLQYFAIVGRDDIIRLTAEAGGSSIARYVLDAAKIGVDENIPILSGDDAETIYELQQVLVDNTEGAYFTKQILGELAKDLGFIGGGISDRLGVKDVRQFAKVYFEDLGSLPVPDFFVNEKGVTPAEDLLPIDSPELPENATLEEKAVALKEKTNLIRQKVERGKSVSGRSSVRQMISSCPTNAASGKADSSKLKSSNVNSNVSSPSRFTRPTLSAIVLPSLKVGIPTRSTSEAAIFLNAVPTLELSRCTPFVNIRFISSVPGGLEERMKRLSIVSFLGAGSDNDKSGLGSAVPADSDISNFAGASALRADLGLASSGMASSGMELFTSPQTLVNADINSDGARNVLDPFKPLMTLDSVRISIAGLGRALLSAKTANVSLILHDRSRLADIAPLVAIDTFGLTNVLIEWGWSHPEGGDLSSNPYGKFLNNLRSKNMFHIVSSDYTMTNEGKVKIDLRLASRGAADASNVSIATGEVVPISQIKPLIQSILAKKLSDVSDSSERAAEIRQEVSVNLGNARSPSSVISRDLFNEFLKILEPQPGGVLLAQSQLGLLITRLVGPDGTGGELKDTKDSLFDIIAAKIEALKSPHATDPFLPSGTANTQVSLGKLIMSFVGSPLAASGRFDETQVFFYRFNHQAAGARKFDISQFQISIEKFQSEMLSVLQENPNMSTLTFLNFIINNFVSDPQDQNYGLTDLYKLRKDTRKSFEEAVSEVKKQLDSKDDNLKVLLKDYDKNLQVSLKQIDSRLQERLTSIYTSDGCGSAPAKFRPPRLKCYMEALPAKTTGLRGNSSVDTGKIILRIHIYDEAATPHESSLFLLSMLNDSEFTSLVKGSGNQITEAVKNRGAPSDSAGPGTTDPKSALGNLGKRFSDTRAGQAVAGMFSEYVAAASPATIKKSIKQTVPSITMGTQYTGVKSISLSANTKGPAANALLLRSITAGDSAGENVTSPVEDVKVIPASLNVTTFGCPLIEYGQQYYMDLQTGTTADNLYAITNINHTLSAGQFDTSFTMTFCSNGTVESFRTTLAEALPKIRDSLIDDAVDAAGDIASTLK